MSWIIAGIYEIQEQIGAGGGGVVYLGRHLRLNKRIVLKADKRTLRTDAEILRREVDMLKGLNHTYIPQVYDFVEENGVVYTVMDYIEGESLDRLLKQGVRPGQPEVIRWACQLLEALCYLHSRPPHGILHGDIKPANIMLRPDGNICLIDYNIALALGEDGAVRVGFSRGYASPEHYGAEYGPADEIGRTQTMEDMEETRTAQTFETLWETEEASKQKEGMLDVRSDLYSLGATLYHLLSGVRPDQIASRVTPLDPSFCSPEVSKILQKAMEESPKRRYQSAEEMLAAFLQLHKRDPRVRRRKRRIAAVSVLLSVMFLAGGAAAFIGMSQIEKMQEALTLAEYSANKLAEGDISAAVSLAMQAIPDKKSILDPPVTAEAKKALADALGVYDLRDGFSAYDTVSLPSAPFTVAISPDGSVFAAVYQYEVAIYDTETKDRLAVFPAWESALSDVIFVDEERILFAGAKGVTAYDWKEDKTLWTGEPGTTLAVSGDRQTAAAVNGQENYAVLYRVEDGKKLAECPFEGQHMESAANDIFANPANRIFCLNQDGSLLAVSLSGGALWIFDVENPDANMILFDETAYGHFEGGFCGRYFAFAANKSDESLFGMVDTKEGAYVASLESRNHFHLKTDENAVYLANENLLVSFDKETLQERELAFLNEASVTDFSIGEDYVMTAGDDQSVSFFDRGANLISTEEMGENHDFIGLAGDYAVIAGRNGPKIRILKMESHRDAEFMTYDARCAHDEARVSADKKTAMLFRYQDFHIFDENGTLLTRAELPDPEQIYDQQFRKSEGDSWLEVIWYDGMVRCYDAADGRLISEEKKELPSEDLYEEFFTDRYRITSELHGVPTAYDLKTGKLAAELETDAYLTYVTQAGDWIITEYVSAEGERYGLLLNEKLETEAYLPGLCDISDGELIFDYGSGNLRRCRLYSLQELMALGEIDTKK